MRCASKSSLFSLETFDFNVWTSLIQRTVAEIGKFISDVRLFYKKDQKIRWTWVFWRIRLPRVLSFVSSTRASPTRNPNQFSSGDRKDDALRSHNYFLDLDTPTYAYAPVCIDVYRSLVCVILGVLKSHCIFSDCRIFQ